MLTKYFKPGKNSKGKPKEVPPRTMPEINTVFSKLVSELGQEEYKKWVCEQTITNLNRQILEISQEAAKRSELDAKAKAAEASVQTVEATK